MGIIADATFIERSTLHTLKDYTPDQMLFFQDMVIPIKIYQTVNGCISVSKHGLFMVVQAKIQIE